VIRKAPGLFSDPGWAWRKLEGKWNVSWPAERPIVPISAGIAFEVRLEVSYSRFINLTHPWRGRCEMPFDLPCCVRSA